MVIFSRMSSCPYLPEESGFKSELCTNPAADVVCVACVDSDVSGMDRVGVQERLMFVPHVLLLVHLECVGGEYGDEFTS